METLGWKITRVEGTTSFGFQWPVEGEVVATNVDPRNTAPCPWRKGDGLCIARTFCGAASSGISLANAQGLWLSYDEKDILGQDRNKIRVSKCRVLGRFDPIAVIRRGAVGADLHAANLSFADLSYCDLRNVDFRYTNLYHTDLSHSDLRGTDFREATMVCCDLTGARVNDANIFFPYDTIGYRS